MNTNHTLHTALCQQSAISNDQLETAICFELPSDGTIPEWVPLIPVGVVIGRDDRTWANPDPAAVISRTRAAEREQPLDYEHSTQKKGPFGEEAPAAGWFSDYRVNNGFIEGHLKLNPRGLQSVQNREYRYLSPVFRHDSAGNIWDIRSAGLTNTPNLLLPALNHETQQETPAMDLEQLLAALATALNIEGTPTAEQVITAVQQQGQSLETAQNREATPDLSMYVPTATHEAVLQRALNAEQQLADNAAASKKVKVDAALDDAIAAGKIAPADREFYATACNSEGGLDRFNAFVEKTPGVTSVSGLDGKDPDAKQTALNAEELKIAEMFGNSAEDLKTYGA